MSSLSEAGQNPKNNPMKSIFWLSKHAVPETYYVTSYQRVGTAPQNTRYYRGNDNFPQ